MRINQRVTCPGGMVGEVMKVEGQKALVYLGTVDFKKVEQWFLISTLRSNVERELEDLL